MSYWEGLVEPTVTEDGDLVLNPNGDIGVSYAGDALAQHVLVRLKTYLGDGRCMPGIGCTLESFIGQPNTQTIGLAIESEVRRALTSDGFFDSSVLAVTVVPTGPETVTILVEPDTSNPALAGVLAFDLDLVSGVFT